MNPYRRRIIGVMQPLVRTIAPTQALDVGAGDGWFAHVLSENAAFLDVIALDVAKRVHSFHPVEVYDGQRLPFSDCSFDLVYAVDVIHHAADPTQLLTEMARCAARHVLIKDHTWRNPLGWLALAGLDELGNRRFGVPSVHNYQRRWEWDGVLQQAGFACRTRIHPLVCHMRLVGLLTNHLQFLALWERKEKTGIASANGLATPRQAGRQAP